jgi:FtsP/CotA-like multicopper oxidase with cupredoxin domain/plastocyanin
LVPSWCGATSLVARSRSPDDEDNEIESPEECIVSLFRRSNREAFGAASASFGLIAVVVAFAALIAVSTKDNGSGGGSVAVASAAVSLQEFSITPEMVTAPLNGTLAVTNNGKVTHNLTVEGTSRHTADLKAGESATLSLKGLKAGSYTLICAISGHKAAGMKAMLMVGGGGGGSASSSLAGSTGKTPAELLSTSAAMDKVMAGPTNAYVGQLTNVISKFTKSGQLDPSLYKANTSYGAMKTNPLLGPPVLEPKVLADGTKEFDITTKIVKWEIEPGKFVSAFTYNGMVPGPTIKVGFGDKVLVHLKNDLPESTVIHFHGIQVPNAMDGVPDVTQAPVKPGASFDYRFTVTDHVAVGMYHSHDFAETQVPDGLAGAFIVGDMPVQSIIGKPAPDLRVPMMLNDSGSIGLSLNGKSFPATAPIVAVEGQWVEVDYMNEGQLAHPMHLHGLAQLVVAKDGLPLANPYSVDTVLVAPGERYTVLIHATSNYLGTAADGSPTFGIWAFHCHILPHAERETGMFGMVTTFIVAPTPRP